MVVTFPAPSPITVINGIVCLYKLLKHAFAGFILNLSFSQHWLGLKFLQSLSIHSLLSQMFPSKDTKQKDFSRPPFHYFITTSKVTRDQ